MFVIDSLVFNLQVKLISAHREEIQYAKVVILKIMGSGEAEPNPLFLWMLPWNAKFSLDKAYHKNYTFIYDIYKLSFFIGRCVKNYHAD